MSKTHVTPGASPTQSYRNLLIRRRTPVPERFLKSASPEAVTRKNLAGLGYPIKREETA